MLQQHTRIRSLGLLAGLALPMVVFSAGGVRSATQSAGGRETAFVIDHRSLDEFDRLSTEQIRAAAGLRFLLRSASIGWNMDQGLNCLMNQFGNRRRRPSACDRGIPPGEVIYNSGYDRRNWIVEPRGNPGWYGKVSDFVDRLGAVSAGSFDAVGFNFNYSDGLTGSNIVDAFFRTNPSAKLGNVATIEALEEEHPGIVFVWWSMALPRQSAATMRQFNERMRAYARERRKVLFDLADIESHAPDGTACTDNAGKGLEAICPGYTNERNSGHLNARGSQRVAKALWVLMARLAAERTR